MDKRQIQFGGNEMEEVDEKKILAAIISNGLCEIYENGIAGGSSTPQSRHIRRMETKENGMTKKNR